MKNGRIIEQSRAEQSIIVSFCIPVYNKANITEKIVNGILCSGSSRFEVIISDNDSEDNTQEVLSHIKDPRLKYYRNDKNIGFAKNWERALELGNGEYLYLVMSRDRIRGENISRLIEILEHASKNNIACIMDGYKLEGIYTGIKAMQKFLGFWHPTGTIFSRKIFHEIPDRTKYFESSDMYPENYIKHYFLLTGKGAFTMSGVYYYPDPLIDKIKIKSSTENDKNLYDTFYAPRRRTQQFFELVDMINEDCPEYFTKHEANNFFSAKFYELLNTVSYGWRNACKNYEWQAHYNQEVKNIGLREMLKNMYNAYHETLKHLRAKGTYTNTKPLIMSYCLVKLLTYDTVKKCARKILNILRNNFKRGGFILL